jgi:tetratricopeptide (TPR) repeat protein
VSVSLERIGDFLARRGGSGDADRALDCFQRGLKVRERLLAANPSSAEAARDVSVSLNKLGDFLARRGALGDADRALDCFQRDLEIAERLLGANPGSAEAARDVSVSLERIGDFLARRGGSGDADRALDCFQRGLEVRERLLGANPGSAAVVRDLVVSHYKLAGFHSGRAEQDEAARHTVALFELLHTAVTQGMEFDPPIMALYKQLQQAFSRT